MEFLKNNFYVVLIIVFIVALIMMFLFFKIEKFIINKLTQRDFRKKYPLEKIENMIYPSKDEQGNVYLGVQYYTWQKNKIGKIDKFYPIGCKLENGETITKKYGQSNQLDKLFSNGKKNSKYSYEYRMYYEYLGIDHKAEYHFTHTGTGNQQTDIHYGDRYYGNVINNDIQKFLSNTQVEKADRIVLEQFMDKVVTDQVTEKDKSKAIETLAKYTGIAKDAVSIITNIVKIFM